MALSEKPRLLGRARALAVERGRCRFRAPRRAHDLGDLVEEPGSMPVSVVTSSTVIPLVERAGDGEHAPRRGVA
jgi:hypothetical protein